MTVVDRADHREPMHLLGKSREQFGDFDSGDAGFDRLEGSADFGRGFGFGIPEIDMTGGTAVEDQDDREGFGADAGWQDAVRAGGAGCGEILED
jgi:hypothetical protein